MSVTTQQNFQRVRGSLTAGSVIIAVGGGKGGIGKSFLSASIGIFLANMGFDTVLVDADLGAPNLHTTLGQDPPKIHFHDFLYGRAKSIIDTAVGTQFAKLRLISGGNDHQELANISLQDQSRLMSAIYNLKADFTVLDLSAGTHTSTLDLFMMAHHNIITMTPDPTSIENAYRFMRAVFFRKVKRFERQLGVQSTVSKIMTATDSSRVRVPADLIERLIKEDPKHGTELKNVMDRMTFELVLNQARGRKDVQLVDSIAAVSRKYFGVPVSVLGHLDYDSAVWNALRKKKPLILEYPNSPVYSQLLAIARDLASPHLKKAVI